MIIVDLLKIEGIKFFEFEEKRYVYLSAEVKKNNTSLRKFHNIALIDDKYLIVINHVPTRKKLVNFYNNLL